MLDVQAAYPSVLWKMMYARFNAGRHILEKASTVTIVITNSAVVKSVILKEYHVQDVLLGKKC